MDRLLRVSSIINNLVTREDVLLATRIKLQEIGLPKMKSEVGKAFFEMDQVVEALYVALTSGLNIILHGPGGFGKTQVVKEFLKVAGLASSTIVGYEDMEVDGLLGVVDIKKLTEEAVYEIKFERSVFANPGVLILEEFLDARPSTAAALKDILTEGGYRRGSYFVESLISSVIICTNKSPDDMSTSVSTAAFYRERFPIVIEVAWTRFDTQTYLRYLQHIKPELSFKHNDFYNIICELASRTSAKGHIVSPRILKYASDLVDFNENLSCLNNLAGLDTTEVEDVKILYLSKNETKRIKIISERLRAAIAPIKTAESYSILFINDSIGKLEMIIAEIDSLSRLTPENLSIIMAVRSECISLLEMLSKKMTIQIPEIDKSSIKAMFVV
jgi:MoxR-like ATPase